ncbi:hypothetical protein B0T16DRAFT_424982 [Cercophora newfieldiana]|uniref:N-acetyltransferase domain-containing protein n=1 Tax=Cercophora newfieldiana TaxID=92897 RepID=A0AA39YS25_9PEZI|nr:hypothetical protein B0T16DRAFT_424982 [Cercophora newfieldiana]
MEELSAPTQIPSKSSPLSETIASFRDASRKLVREWGFLRSVFAESCLSPGAVHCLIEIGDARDDASLRSASNLGAELRVSQAELERIVSELVGAGCIVAVDGGDTVGGDIAYTLTPTGAQTLGAVNAYAEDQVSRSLAVVSPGSVADITAAFRVYTAALERIRGDRDIKVHAGYFPGLISSSVQMHMDYYHTRIGWGREFETGLSTTLASLVGRLDNPLNQAWCAVETLPSSNTAQREQKIIGTIFIDGEIPSRPGSARLRAFIVDGSARGLGLGRKLVGVAMAFVKQSGFKECRLTTMRSLGAARKLYEAAGFVEIAEVQKVIWGQEVGELEYVWKAETV